MPRGNLNHSRPILSPLDEKLCSLAAGSPEIFQEAVQIAIVVSFPSERASIAVALLLYLGDVFTLGISSLAAAMASPSDLIAAVALAPCTPAVVSCSNKMPSRRRFCPSISVLKARSRS